MMIELEITAAERDRREKYEDGWNDGVEESVAVLKAKADELRAIGDTTAGMMARILDEQASAIAALLRN